MGRGITRGVDRRPLLPNRLDPLRLGPFFRPLIAKSETLLADLLVIVVGERPTPDGKLAVLRGGRHVKSNGNRTRNHFVSLCRNHTICK